MSTINQIEQVENHVKEFMQNVNNTPVLFYFTHISHANVPVSNPLPTIGLIIRNLTLTHIEKFKLVDVAPITVELALTSFFLLEHTKRVTGYDVDGNEVCEMKPIFTMHKTNVKSVFNDIVYVPSLQGYLTLDFN